ncbi:hypothetical protein GZH53_06930 [Flavihumibacter sp. R14]|nr:hypothetical protein [Flavihumibacter soli]
MKTVKLLSTVLIATLSLSALADVNPNRKARKANRAAGRVISYPAMEWGNPSDIQSADLNELKNTHSLFEAPEMIWGSPDEAATPSVENLKNTHLVASPEMVWGNPEDASLASVEGLKDAPMISYPTMVWGNADDVNAGSAQLLANR